MRTPPAPAKVSGYVATEADVCVLLRRGPNRRCLMVRWDLRDDTFETGQWVKAQVYGGALSADGRLFAYSLASYARRPEAIPEYVAICRPPYFTALALWPTLFHQVERALWTEDSPPRLKGPDVGTVPDGTDLAFLKKIYAQAGQDWEGDPSDEKALGADWISRDRRGRLLIVRAGRVSVREGLNDERDLIDLNPLRFKPLPPPDWAHQWP